MTKKYQYFVNKILSFTVVLTNFRTQNQFFVFSSRPRCVPDSIKHIEKFQKDHIIAPIQLEVKVSNLSSIRTLYF